VGLEGETLAIDGFEGSEENGKFASAEVDVRGDVPAGLENIPIIPYLDPIIAPPRHKPPHARRTRLTTHQTPRHHRRRPTHRIDPGPMRVKHLMRPIALLELQHADLAVGAGAREQAAGFVGGPGDDVDGGGVQGEGGDGLPGWGGGGGGLGGGFAPDFHGAVVGGGGEDGAVFWVGLCKGLGGWFVGGGGWVGGGEADP